MRIGSGLIFGWGQGVADKTEMPIQMAKREISNRQEQVQSLVVSSAPCQQDLNSAGWRAFQERFPYANRSPILELKRCYLRNMLRLRPQSIE